MKKSTIKTPEQYWPEVEQRLTEYFKKCSESGIANFKLISDKQKISISEHIYAADRTDIKFKFNITYIHSANDIAATHSNYSEDPVENRAIFNQHAANVIFNSAKEAKITLIHVSNKFKVEDPDTQIMITTKAPKLLVHEGKAVSAATIII